MQKLKAFRLFFSLAALLFVAKPFFGFDTVNMQGKAINIHTILVKSFTKRKPEGIEEADANVSAIHRLLTSPLLFLQSAIYILLLAIFPLTIKLCDGLINWHLHKKRYGLLSPQYAYLLTGKLII